MTRNAESKTAPVAILIVNGGHNPSGGAWIELCLSKVAKHTNKGQYQLYLWNNDKECEYFKKAVMVYAPGAKIFQLEENEDLPHFHAIPLQKLYEIAKLEGHEWIVTLDSDSHPIKNGWLDQMTKTAVDDCVLTGVWRDELSGGIQPYIHASGLCVQKKFLNRFDLRFDTVVTRPDGDTLSDFSTTAIENGFVIKPMVRSNLAQFHKLIGGIYGDLIYHHGAGSRRNILFWGEADSRYRRQLNTVIASETASLLMKRYDQYMAYLRFGHLSNMPIRLAILNWLSAAKPTIASRIVLAVLFWRLLLNEQC